MKALFHNFMGVNYINESARDLMSEHFVSLFLLLPVH